MSDATTIPVASPSPDPDRAGPVALPRVGRLLRLVRNLVAYGTNLIATLQQGTSAQRCDAARLAFGTKDLALIIARITCGLRRAAGLEARLNQYVRRGRDLPLPAHRPSAPRAQPAASPADAPPADAPPADAPADPARNTLLSVLPTAEEIAEQVRTRSLGIVIGDICRDLGFASGMVDGALWQELMEAVLECGIDLTRFIRGEPPVADDDEDERDAAVTAGPRPGARVALAVAAQPP